MDMELVNKQQEINDIMLLDEGNYWRARGAMNNMALEEYEDSHPLFMNDAAEDLQGSNSLGGNNQPKEEDGVQGVAPHPAPIS